MGGLGDPYLSCGFPQGALWYGFLQVMATLNP